MYSEIVKWFNQCSYDHYHVVSLVQITCQADSDLTWRQLNDSVACLIDFRMMSSKYQDQDDVEFWQDFVAQHAKTIVSKLRWI